MIINCNGEILTLDKHRAMYWAAKKMLVITDLHLGKSAHFRKHGIQVPATVGFTDLQRLSGLLEKYTTDILLITGDMFHNKMNSDITGFESWRKTFPLLKIWLILGNHDDLKTADYLQLGIEVYARELCLAPFRFIHEPPPIASDEYYSISGHLHPGVTLYGKARQQLKFPCFYFGKQGAILPAFSTFTGLSKIKPQEGGQVYVITPLAVIAV